MKKHIFVVRTKQDLERCFPIMKELRPHLSFEEYLYLYEQAHQRDSYEIAAVERGTEILAVMGYRFLFDYVRGKHLYVDDLVCSHKVRSQGFGANLLEYAEQVAKNHDCATLRLCAGLENERGIRFYEREGWLKRAYAFSKKI